MERLHIPHDPEITQDVGAFALRLMIDEMFEKSDAEIFRILNQYRGDEYGENTVQSGN